MCGFSYIDDANKEVSRFVWRTFILRTFERHTQKHTQYHGKSDEYRRYGLNEFYEWGKHL